MEIGPRRLVKAAIQYRLQGQWRAYARSIQLTEVTLGDVTEAIWTLVEPSCARLIASSSSD
ncbi:hypothetical protein LPU83_pLPU83c_0259 (plasmid) [Rhizobium favelukesii]|uniref:Uncharacterized protein n=1 Tax=Rhizobium favelukesii TaxID=348824 RepID=W6S370_9HYPH|nr:hypothetical protein LPU83_pLPU83c_0259 [Rhizobium favelukesii]